MQYIYPTGTYLAITRGVKRGGTGEHLGVDFGWNTGYAGQPIIAIADGTVLTAVNGYGNTYPNSKIYGNYVIIQHDGGMYSLYAHLAKGINVKSGQKIKQGDKIGNMGNSGYSAGQHLHFELRKGGNSKSYVIDPLDYLVCPQNVKISDKSEYHERIRKEDTVNPLYKIELPLVSNGDKAEILELADRLKLQRIVTKL